MVDMQTLKEAAKIYHTSISSVRAIVNKFKTNRNYIEELLNRDEMNLDHQREVIEVVSALL